MVSAAAAPGGPAATPAAMDAVLADVPRIEPSGRAEAGARVDEFHGKRARSVLKDGRMKSVEPAVSPSGPSGHGGRDVFAAPVLDVQDGDADVALCVHDAPDQV